MFVRRTMFLVLWVACVDAGKLRLMAVLLTAGAQVTRYSYDEAGRQEYVIKLVESKYPELGYSGEHHTYTDYDGLGRQILTAEYNADDVDPNQMRVTASCYDDQGRLEAMAALLTDDWPADGVQFDWQAAPDGSAQITRFEYGADVVDQSGAVISAHNGWISKVYYPDPTTGKPKATADLTFQYYSDGSVATRTDAEGIRFRYLHDELGRRTECRIEFTSTADKTYHAASNPIGLIKYAYTPDGKLIKASAYDLDGTELQFENQFDYSDGRGNLTREYQSHSGPVVLGTTPAIDYLWDFSPITAGNHDRLTTLSYPARPDSSQRRTLTFNYNASGADDALSRVTSIGDSDLAATIASYGYMGTSRRVSVALGNGVSQTVTDSTGCTGLDRFGRMVDLHYRLAGQTVHRYQSGYDASGNRTYARTTQAPTPGTPDPVLHDNDRSYLYSYDGLNRLIDAQLGKLNSTNAAIESAPAVALARNTTWSLDSLGNWAALQGPGVTGPLDPNYRHAYVRRDDTNGDGDYTDGFSFINQPVSMNNQITTLVEEVAETTLVHDQRGNLIWDGDYVYRYDAFSRLIGVYERGSAQFDMATGRITDTGALGPPKALETPPLDAVACDVENIPPVAAPREASGGADRAFDPGLGGSHLFGGGGFAGGHHVREAIEEIGRVVRAGAGLGVVLHGKDGQVAVHEPF